VKTEPIVCNNTFFFCPNGTKPEGNKKLITRLGCETFCGHGCDLDPLDNIIIRFILWLLPVLILTAHFHFPALGKANMLHIPSANWPSGGSSNPSFRVHLVCDRLFAIFLLFCPFFYLYKRSFLPLDI
jgi:hypothetical protein